MTVNFQMLDNAALMWNALTWVDEKGETVFDPSATGDEAECQRKGGARGTDPIGGVGVVE